MNDLEIPARPAAGAKPMELSTLRSNAGIAAAAETAKQLVQARFLVARHSPRNEEDARDRILRACRRPTFAAVALYAKPIGGTTVKGPSVRLADELAKAYGNIDVRCDVIHEDDETRHVQVTACDLESNLTRSQTVVVRKTVERKSPRDGQEVLSSRTNSAGKVTYLIRANDDDLLVKEAALVAKARRGLQLQLIPADLVDEAQEVARQTIASGAKSDPDAECKRILDAFAELGVRPSSLERIIGHPVAQASPADILTLREVYTSIRDGEARIEDYIEQADQPAQPTADPNAKARDALMAATKKPVVAAPAPAAPAPAPKAQASEKPKARRTRKPEAPATAPVEDVEAEAQVVEPEEETQAPAVADEDVPQDAPAAAEDKHYQFGGDKDFNETIFVSRKGTVYTREMCERGLSGCEQPHIDRLAREAGVDTIDRDSIALGQYDEASFIKIAERLLS